MHKLSNQYSPVGHQTMLSLARVILALSGGCWRSMCSTFGLVSLLGLLNCRDKGRLSKTMYWESEEYQHSLAELIGEIKKFVHGALGHSSWATLRHSQILWLQYLRECLHWKCYRLFSMGLCIHGLGPDWEKPPLAGETARLSLKPRARTRVPKCSSWYWVKSNSGHGL